MSTFAKTFKGTFLSNDYEINVMRTLFLQLVALAVLVFAGLANAAKEETIIYYHTDMLGSPVAATSKTGAILWQERYQPYGEKELNEAAPDNNIGYTGHRNEDYGLVYMQARYYDPEIGRFYGVDPKDFTETNFQSFNRYAYANNNPYAFIDPDGRSPISVLAKQIAKQGFKEGIKRFGQRQTKRLGRYMNKDQRAEFASDLADVIGSLDSSPIEIAIELIPVAGDAYGAAKFGKQVSNAFDKMQDLENKWVQKIFDSLPPSQRKKFMNAMRNAGVRDAKKDQGVSNAGSGLEGHHKSWVSRDPSRASDPRNIEFLTPDAHKNKHR